MAKANGSSGAANADERSASVHDIARELFVAHWRYRGGLAAWSVSVECYRAAADFVRVSEQIASGATPDDVIASVELADETKQATAAASVN